MFPVLLIAGAVAGVAAYKNKQTDKSASGRIVPTTYSGVNLNAGLHSPSRVSPLPAIDRTPASIDLGDRIPRHVATPPVVASQNVPPGFTNQFPGAAPSYNPPTRTLPAGGGGRDIPSTNAAPATPPRVTPPPVATPPPAIISTVPNSQGYYDLLAQAHLHNTPGNTCDPHDVSCVSNDNARAAAVQQLWAEKYQVTGAPANLILNFTNQTAAQVTEFRDDSNPLNGGNVIDTRGIMEQIFG